MQTNTKFVKDCKYIFSFSFVFGSIVINNEIKQHAHTEADTVAVVAYELKGGEVGGSIGEHVVIDKVIVCRRNENIPLE